MLHVFHQNISIPEISNYIVAKKAMEHCSEEPKILNESSNGCIRPAQVALTFDLRLIYWCCLLVPRTTRRTNKYGANEHGSMSCLRGMWNLRVENTRPNFDPKPFLSLPKYIRCTSNEI